MVRKFFVASFVLTLGIAAVLLAQQTQFAKFVPVTQEMLTNPSPDDWLMFSRTYDAQRFSPLKQITKQNVSQLRLVFAREMTTGTQESIPIVHQGVIYTIATQGAVQAIDGTNGVLIWEYKRPGQASKSKGLAMSEDLIYYTTPDGAVVALDARSGQVRWETKVGAAAGTSGPIVVEGKV